MNAHGPELSRRALLRGGAAWLGAAAFPSAVQALLARQSRAGRPRAAEVANPYGEPVPTLDQASGLPLLRLPPDFTYRSFGWAGDPMLDGSPTPSNHDGMAVVQVLDNRSRDIVLVRNHEIAFGPNIGGPSGPIYDPVVAFGSLTLGGGTTTLVFRRGQWVSSQPSLGGTAGNCAGGATPWGSWLTCEETISDGRPQGALIHGFVFEVPAPALGPASAVPITDMGLFKHEAVAIDPRTGFAYETEDCSPNSGFYRYRPNDLGGRIGSLEEGGALDMLKVVGTAGADLRGAFAGDAYDVEWVAIPDPALLPDEAVGVLLYSGPSGPYRQGSDGGAARFARLEGCTYASGSIWFVDTSGGALGCGALWRYDPPETTGTSHGRLTAVYVAEGRPGGDNPDNVTVSPRGGLLLCEDGGNADGTRLLGVTPDGVSFTFAVSEVAFASSPPGRPTIAAGDFRSIEFAGVCFDPTGRWLFVNNYIPGITFAISGPWARGPL